MSVVIDKLCVAAIACLLSMPALSAIAQAPAAMPAVRTLSEPPPIAPAEARVVSEVPPHSWFSRPALRVTFGAEPDPWAVTVFGFVEADYIYDSTRSYDDAIGNALVARSDTYAGRVSRAQFSIRNTRLGFMFNSPRVGGVRGSAVLEGDFFGNQPPGVSERSFFDSPAFRVRHAYVLLQNDYVDVLAGQSYGVFGWQNYFFPCSIEFLGLPNQLFSRSVELRLSHTFALGSDFSLDVAAAAVRPAQRDSAVPDAQAGIRFSVNRWKGITTPGNTGTVAQPMSIGVSGTVRQFKVNAFTPPPTQTSNSATGWGLSLDAFIPIIAAAHGGDRGNRLTLNGSYVTGTGIADLITAGGGATFPTLPNPAQANPPPLYTANIDDGLVTFDTQGVMHTIDWWALRAGLQYYLPPSGRVIVSANYTQAHSGNMAKLYPKGGAEIELLTHVADRSHYADVNVMWDVTPAIRIGVSGQYTQVSYLDRVAPHNIRGMGQVLYAF